ncbi:MAG: germination protein YpeB [Oscillospiraceae bacterium]|nr:germination protein YpeB [Oscillospiraceae bacterium]
MNEKKMSFRAKARIFLYTAAVITVLGIFGIVQYTKAQKFERETQLTKQMALISLDEYLGNIAGDLEKTIYTSTPTMLSQLSTELWRQSSGAKNSLMMLPTTNGTLGNTYKFLSQVGEFVMALGRKSSAGEEISEEEREQLKKLYEYCTVLNEQVNSMCYDMQNDELTFEEYKSTLLGGNTGVSTVGKSLDDAEQSLSDLPSLIYDGPFSDHIEQSEPKFLKGTDEITKNKALTVAGDACEEEKASLKFAYEESGAIPCYVFQSDNCTVAVTKNGGKVLYMINAQFAGEIQVKYEEAIETALKFLKKIGYTNLKESYYFTEDGICTINFAGYENGIVYYPDLIKVSVNLETGKVHSFDASGYVSNHFNRTESTQIITEDDARGIINPNLQILGVQLCVIPTEWKSEQYCYEVHCSTDNGQELLVYIDCTTGEEDNILILLYSDGGVLTK